MLTVVVYWKFTCVLLLLHYNHFTGLPAVLGYQKKYSPLTYPGHQPSFISFFHLLWSIATSLFNLRAWQFFTQPLSSRLWFTCVLHSIWKEWIIYAVMVIWCMYTLMFAILNNSGADLLNTVHCFPWDHKVLMCLSIIYHTTVLRPFSGTTEVPEENFWTLWCKGRLTEEDTPTIWLGATPSGLTRAIFHHPPFFTGRMPFLPPNQQC